MSSITGATFSADTPNLPKRYSARPRCRCSGRPPSIARIVPQDNPQFRPRHSCRVRPRRSNSFVEWRYFRSGRRKRPCLVSRHRPTMTNVPSAKISWRRMCRIRSCRWDRYPGPRVKIFPGFAVATYISPLGACDNARNLCRSGFSRYSNKYRCLAAREWRPYFSAQKNILRGRKAPSRNTRSSREVHSVSGNPSGDIFMTSAPPVADENKRE